MPNLDWIGKDAVVNYHRQVPYRLLRCHEDLSVGDAADGNLLIEGDNLHALKALLPYYAGKVKCIYIDPLYNTGNEGWVYNDAVNAPEMKAWLADALAGRPVNVDDLSRHDKWLCMMYPRLSLLHQLLREDGAIFISIDDNEVQRYATSWMDFVVLLNDGRVLVVEYKGGDRVSNADTREKEAIGKLWEARSQGRCLFRLVSADDCEGQLPAVGGA